MEFSQKITVFLIIFGVCGVIASYILAFMGLPVNEAVTISLITEVIMVCFGYLTYQYRLKDSRNKYKLDKDGKPFEIAENQ